MIPLCRPLHMYRFHLELSSTSSAYLSTNKEHSLVYDVLQIVYASSNLTCFIYLKSLINVNRELTHELLERYTKFWRHYFSKSQGVLVDTSIGSVLCFQPKEGKGANLLNERRVNSYISIQKYLTFLKLFFPFTIQFCFNWIVFSSPTNQTAHIQSPCLQNNFLCRWFRSLSTAKDFCPSLIN
jgi:hypothetical protein